MERFVVPVITAISPVIVAVITVWLNNRVISFKIENLTKTVEKHNGVVERVAVLEKENTTAFKRIDELKVGIEKTEEHQNNNFNTIVELLQKGK